MNKESEVETDLFYKIIDEDKINKFEEEFYAALKSQKIAGKRKDDDKEDHDKNVKKSKTKWLLKINIKSLIQEYFHYISPIMSNCQAVI